MFEFRWVVAHWDKYDGASFVPVTEEPVLQFRQMENPLELGLSEPLWTDWREVPTHFIDQT